MSDAAAGAPAKDMIAKLCVDLVAELFTTPDRSDLDDELLRVALRVIGERTGAQRVSSAHDVPTTEGPAQ